MATTPTFTQVAAVITDLVSITVISNATSQLTVMLNALGSCWVGPGSLVLVAIPGVNQLNGLYIIANAEPNDNCTSPNTVRLYRTVSFAELTIGQLFFDRCSRGLYRVSMVTTTGSMIDLLVPRIPCECNDPPTRGDCHTQCNHHEACRCNDITVIECQCYECCDRRHRRKQRKHEKQHKIKKCSRC